MSQVARTPAEGVNGLKRLHRRAACDGAAMVCNLRALVRALCVAMAAAATGCAEEPEPSMGPEPATALRAAELRTIGAPGPQDLPFGEALLTYARQVGSIHAFAKTRADPQIHAAVLELATVLDRIPAAAAQPALRRTAALIRAQQAAVDPEEAEMVATQRSLSLAATAILNLAVGSYGGSPQISAQARAFARMVEAIDPDRSPPDRATVIDALVHAERVLTAMYAANVRPQMPLGSSG